MNLRLLLPIGCLALALLQPAAAIERTAKRSFPVQPGASVTVDTHRGAIFIEQTEGNEVRAEVRMEFPTEQEEEASKAIEALELEMEPAGGGVLIRARNPSESRAIFTWEESKRIDLTFRVWVPAGMTVELSTLDGSVTVGNRTGSVVATTRAGTIFCRRIDGPVRATVESGAIVISRCTGAVDLRVQRGTITAGTLLGPATLRNDSGEIEVGSAYRGITAKTSAGDILVGLQKGFSGETKIEADGGSVLLRVEPSAALSVTASASWGRVQTTLPFAVTAGASGKRNLTANLNGGGPAVRLQASGGQVRIEGHSRFFDLKEED